MVVRLDDALAGGLAAVRSIELGEEIGDVAIDRTWTQKEMSSDLRIGQALAKEGQDISFASGQVNRRGSRRWWCKEKRLG